MKFLSNILIFLSICFVCFAHIASAASPEITITKESNSLSIGDTFLVEITASSETQNVNVFEGDIIFDSEKLEAKNISTGGSACSLWTRYPIISNESGRISFTGGTQNQISGKNIKLFTIAFLAKKAGETHIRIGDNSFIYAADGLGTIMTPERGELTFSISKEVKTNSNDEWEKLIQQDSISPTNVQVELGKEESILNKKFFLSFSGEDRETGISRYEISEDGGKTFISSESPYVLKNQYGEQYIKIRAIDKAENYYEREIKISLPEKPFYMKHEFIIIIFCGLSGIGYIFYKKKKKEKCCI